MWVDPRNCNHFPQLLALGEAIRKEYVQWKTKHDVYKDALCVYGYEYETENVQLKNPNEYMAETPETFEVQHAKDWWAIGLYYDKQYVGEQLFPGEWKESTAILKSIPGVYQAIINFVVPNGKIPFHYDTGSWERIQASQGKQVTGYTAVLAIDTPSPNQFSFMNNEDIRHFNVGDVYAFDGRNYSHEIINGTDQWRVTCVVDIADSEWSTVYGGSYVVG